MTSVSRAQILYSNPSRAIGSTVMYECDIGYFLEGPETRTCMDDGTWTLTDPSCSELLYCSASCCCACLLLYLYVDD